MAQILDNKFSLDDFATQAARLQPIENNWAEIVTMISPPASIQTFGQNCYTLYMDLW